MCRGAVIRVVPPSAVPDEGLVAEGGGMGAPTVSLEKLKSYECEQAGLAAVKAGAAVSLTYDAVPWSLILLCMLKLGMQSASHTALYETS